MRTDALWIPLLVAACAAETPTPRTPPQATSDPAAITQLDGYRSRLIAEAEFGGQARLLEVGAQAGPALLLVHGIGDGGARDFFPILPQLAARYHVFAVDLPGFGNSTHGTALYSPERYVRFLDATIRPNVNGQFVLLGHSMGAAIALQYAYRHPEALSHLVLVDAAGILHREALVPFMAQYGIGRFFEPAGGVAGAVTSLLVSRALGPEALLENDFARAHGFSDPKQIAAAALIVHDFGPAIAESRTPTLVVWGRHDGIAPLRTGTLLSARLPLARLKILEHSAHVPMESEPEALVSTVLQWLDTPDAEPPDPPQKSQRTGRCDQTPNARFEGDYDSIEIVNCQGVQLNEVRARTVRIWASEVVMEASRIEGAELAVYATRSRLEVTGCILSGNPALALDASELDIAGTELRGTAVTVRNKEPSRILFSASSVSDLQGRHYRHEPVDLAKDEAF